MPARSPIATILGCLAALATALACAGCGSTSATLDPIAQAAETTTHSGGARIEMTVQASGAALGAGMTLKGSGAVNLRRQEGQLTFDLSGLPAGVTSKLGAGALQFTELFTKGALYMSSPLFAGQLPGGAKWMKLDLAKLEAGMGIDPRSLASQQASPGQYLQYLSASGGVTRLGRETVRGTATTHYRGTVDLSKAAEMMPSSDRSKTKAAIQKILSQVGSSPIPVQVWIDDHHLVRRMSMAIPLSVGDQHAGTTIEFELFGFGPTASVTPPASGEVFDATQTSLPGLGSGG